jgi:hypothetical protein
MGKTFSMDCWCEVELSESSLAWVPNSKVPVSTSIYTTWSPIVMEIATLVRNLEEAVASNQWIFAPAETSRSFKAWL